jgi:hypothetical protein
MCGDTLSSDPPKRFAYNIAVAIFAYIAPLIAIFYSYFHILYVLQKRCDRRTFRFGKCHDGSTRNYDNQLNNSLKSNSTKSFNHERGRGGAEQSLAREEINTHNMKTITRAKLKTLKLTAIIGKHIFADKIQFKHIFSLFSHLFYSLLDTLLLYCVFSSYN